MSSLSMRLFVAIDIDPPIREKLAGFLDGVRGFAPDVRWVTPESFHVTLKFIGEQPPEQLQAIKSALGQVRGKAAAIAFRGYGFFPTAKSARLFWIGMEAGPELADLAHSVDDALTPLGLERETRAFSPHLTLARAGSGRPGRQRGDRPNPSFQRLQEKLAALTQPEFGSMTARDFFLYQSKLSPAGAQYTKLERYSLDKA